METVEALLPGSERAVPDRITPAAGAYALFVRLERALDIDRGNVKGTLAPGWYVYAGSARGGGGIRARLTRHFRADKPIRWHVDELTTRADAMAALAIPGGCECAVVERLSRSDRFHSPLRGFGSSDCRTCPAHLLACAGTHP